jgi:hypothetical protein
MHHIHEKGTTVTNTEHSPKAPHSTGIFAMLCGLLGAKGTGARIAALLTIAAAMAAFSATPALAKEVHAYNSSFGSEGSAPGQFKEPQGVAVNDSTNFAEPGAGDVYVVDRGNNRVERFSSAGGPIGQFNGSGTVEVEPGKVEVGKAAPTGAFSDPTWVAVDNAPLSLSHGDVYVTDNAHKVVDKFSETGVYLGQITKAVCPKPKPFGVVGAEEAEEEAICPQGSEVPFGELYGVAVDTAGGLWVYQQLTGDGLTDAVVASYSDATVNEFRTSFRPVPLHNAFLGIANPDNSDGLFPGLAVGPDGDVYVSNAPELGERNNAPRKFLQFNSAGVAAGAHGKYAIDAAVNLSNNELYIDEETRENGTQTEDIGTSVAAVGSENFGSEDLSAGATGIAVNSSTGNVLSNGVYVVDSAVDRVDFFAAVEIPTVTTEPASNVEIKQEAGHAVVSATLGGAVNPNGLPVTSCEFEYGTSTSYGHSVPCGQSLEAISKGKDGKGDEAVPVTADITNLLPDNTYHFRLRAANKNDEGELLRPGLDQSFPTPGPSITEAPAAEVTTTTATLSGEVNPGGLPLSRCEFEYGTSTEYYEHSAPCEPDAGAIGSGTAPVKVHADLKGLLGGRTYRFRLLVTTEVFATKEAVTIAGAGMSFPTSAVPVVAGGEALDVTAGGAELRATVNPEGLQVSHCAFEYGTSASYGLLVRCAQKKSAIGAGTEPVPVSAQLSELIPNTTYFWRLSVRDSNGEGYEPGHTFVYPTTGAELPDRRAYELVTPPQKDGALVGDVFFGNKPAVSEGPEGLHKGPSRVIALSIQCFGSAESCTANRPNNGEPFEFTRTPAGWVTTALAPPATQFSENTPFSFSADEGTALFSMPSGPTTGDEWYARSSGGSFLEIGPATPPGVTTIEPFKIRQNQSTADLSHLIWEQSNSAGAPWPFDKTTGEQSLYEYAGTHNPEPFLVGVTGVKGSTELIGTCGAGFGDAFGNGGDTLGALSADGRTVYFTAEPCSGGTGTNAGKGLPVRELYARVDGELPEPGAAHTVAISEPQALAPGVRAECVSTQCTANTSVANERTAWREGVFQGASEDGSKVFFTSEQQLTDQATQGENNLYESECTKECEQAGEQRRLIDVSAGSPTPEVQGVVAISADGSHVYFVARGVLSAAPNRQGQSARPGAYNLYVYAEGHTAFIASLPGSDSRNWSAEGPLANVTPDGHFLVFESHARLTPDDTGGEAETQIFRYDAASEELVRISIGENGFDDNGNAGTGDPSIVGAGDTRSDPTMSNDGSYVFFQSPRGLTPHALDDVVIRLIVSEPHLGSGYKEVRTEYAQNVYEYHEGHVYLISDGRDASNASTPCKGGEVGESQTETFDSSVCLLGADATGHNVFFMTADQLVPADTDTQVDIYDARICEPAAGNPCIVEPPPPLPPCLGEACHGIPPERSPLLTGGSATLNGKGNLVPALTPAVVKKKVAKCKKVVVKNKGKKKTECIKPKKAKKSAKRASKDRRAGS